MSLSRSQVRPGKFRVYDSEVVTREVKFKVLSREFDFEAAESLAFASVSAFSRYSLRSFADV